MSSLIDFSLLKHKSRCFNVESLELGADTLVLTSSEEGVAILWSIIKKRPIFIFKHNQEFEVLRSSFLDDIAYKVMTCGSDGVVNIWQQDAPAQ